MDIQSKPVSARAHTAVATVDELKGVAIAAMQHQLGLADGDVLSSDAAVGPDGSITVTMIALTADEVVPAPAPAPAAQDPTPVLTVVPVATAAAPAIPTGIVVPAV